MSRIDPRNPKDLVGSAKIPYHLWPETATILGSLGVLEGMLKYGRSNWRTTPIYYSIYYDAAMRHLKAAFEGEEVAPDSEIDHLGHALASIGILVDARAAGTLVDDRNYPGGYHKLLAEATPMVVKLKERYAERDPRHFTIRDADGKVNPSPGDTKAKAGNDSD